MSPDTPPQANSRKLGRAGTGIGTALAGLLATLIVTWAPVFGVTLRAPETPPTKTAVIVLRTHPTRAVLAGIRAFAVGADDFTDMSERALLDSADEVLRGRYGVDGTSHAVAVPFVASEELYGTTALPFQLCRFAVPGLLVQAYAVSHDLKYLRAALEYIDAWAAFESSLLLPRGYVFNDHAISARAIVVTEVWRWYRDSEIFEDSQAVRLLAYATRLSRLLTQPGLYEYRSNHGIMQNLSLLHLAVAFPGLPQVSYGGRVGARRFASQFEYYVNPEGVVLEHSAGYQYYGIRCMYAAARYFALLGVSLPADFASRYRRALEFEAALRRPDGTLAPVGDTDDDPYPPHPALDAAMDARIAVPGPGPGMSPEKPAANVLAPAAGYAIAWTGLDRWPATDGLSQTVMQWARFPSAAHKHADDLGVSIWGHGMQWITSVGYWPYVAGREQAVGWRSSNAPHWQAESPAADRRSTLLGSVVSSDLAFVDVASTSSESRRVRRQAVQLNGHVWALVDDFESTRNGRAEIVWRTSPEVQIQPETQRSFWLIPRDGSPRMRLEFAAKGDWGFDADIHGAAAWNSGVWSNGEHAASPAIRALGPEGAATLVTVLSLQEAPPSADGRPTVQFERRASDDWTIEIAGPVRARVTIERSRDRLTATGGATSDRTWIIGNHETRDAMQEGRTVRLFEAVARLYGTPFQPMLDRRAKVSLVAIAAATVQLALAWGVRRWSRVSIALIAISGLAWLTLCIFLHKVFLV